MYDINDDHISILYKDGTIKDIAEASELLNVDLLSKKFANITFVINVCDKNLVSLQQIFKQKLILWSFPQSR